MRNKIQVLKTLITANKEIQNLFELYKQKNLQLSEIELYTNFLNILREMEHHFKL